MSDIVSMAEWLGGSALMTRQRVKHAVRLDCQFGAMEDETVKRLWDECVEDDSGSYSVDGFSCEDIHAELNRRGLGEYCAV